MTHVCDVCIWPVCAICREALKVDLKWAHRMMEKAGTISKEARPHLKWPVVEEGVCVYVCVCVFV